MKPIYVHYGYSISVADLTVQDKGISKRTRQI